jgi:hypothetical protein
MARYTSSQPITTISSTQITEIPTQTGFNAGDPVYFNNGDYKNPSNLTAPSKVNFPVFYQASILSGGNGGFGFPFNSYTQLNGSSQNNCGTAYGQNQANLIAAFTAGSGTSGAFTVTVTSATGIVVGQPVTGVGIGVGATVSIIAGTTITLSVANSGTVSGNLSFLTGNIVQVYMSASSLKPYFRIVNSSGTVVYGPTQISSSTSVQYGLMTVSALTGGGFAVSYNAGAAYICTSVWSNTGTVVTANFNDALPSGSQTSSNQVAMTPLANGGFVVVTNNTSNNMYFKIYTATAGATTAFTSLGTNIGSYAWSFNVASRSDSSFLVGWPTSSGFTYALYNSAGGSITSATISAPNGGGAYSTANDVCCLADGTTYVIAFNDYNTATTDYLPTLYLLPSGNTLGSAITPVAKANTYGSSISSVSSFTGIIRLVPQSTGGFCLIFADAQPTLYYVFSNASATTFYPGSTTAGNTNPGVIPNTFIYNTANQAPRLSALENNGNITLYVNAWYMPSNALNMIGFNISESTYSITPSLVGTPPSVPTVSSTTGALATSQSYPTGLKYYAANNDNQTYTSASASVSVGPTVLNNFNTDGVHSCTLTNGNIVVAYRTSNGGSTNSIYLSIFSPTGVLLQTLNPTLAYTAYSGTLYTCTVRVCAMQGGKFALAYATNQSTPSIVSLVIFSSTYAITFNNSITSMASQGTANRTEGGGFDICGLTGSDNIAMAFYNASSQLSYAIINNAGTYLSGGAFVTSVQNPSICANSYGGFSITVFASGSGSQYLYNYVPAGSNNYAQTNNGSFGGSTTSNSTSPTFKPFYSNGGALLGGCANSSSANYWQLNTWDTNGITTTPAYSAYYGNTQTYGSVSTNYGCQALGATGFGTVTTAAVNDTNASTTLTITGYLPQPNYTVSSGYFSSTVYSWPASARTTASISISTTYGNLWITPALGFGSFICWRDSNGYVNYLVANTLPYNAFASLTAGTSTSTVVPVYPTNTSTSGAITNAVLTGIAATTASAGGSGQVIINGTAQLGSSYPSSGTASFDHQGQGVDGVRGTVNGRLVNMQGNS